MSNFLPRLFEQHRAPRCFDDFSQQTKIGQGAFASVYRAYDPSRSRVVALKKINLSAITDAVTLRTTLSEIELFKKLRHESVVQCYGSFRETEPIQNSRKLPRDYLTLVLEFVDGGDLEHWIARKAAPLRQMVPESEIWYIFSQIANGVEYIHKNRIIHRDLKPANVLLTRQCHVKLTDFGLSRVQNRNTGAKTVCGTPYYMAPERIAELGYSFTSDVWSLGCILYEMAALKSPFFGEKENITSLADKIKNADYPPIADDCYTDQLVMLLDACMNPTGSDRPNALEVKSIANHMMSHFYPNMRRH